MRSGCSGRVWRCFLSSASGRLCRPVRCSLHVQVRVGEIDYGVAGGILDVRGADVPFLRYRPVEYAGTGRHLVHIEFRHAAASDRRGRTPSPVRLRQMGYSSAPAHTCAPRRWRSSAPSARDEPRPACIVTFQPRYWRRFHFNTPKLSPSAPFTRPRVSAGTLNPNRRARVYSVLAAGECRLACFLQ